MSKGWDNAGELEAISSGFDWRRFDNSVKARMYTVAGFRGEAGIQPLDHTPASREFAEHGSQSQYNRMIEEFANRSGRTVFPRFHSLGWKKGAAENCSIAKSGWVGRRC